MKVRFKKVKSNRTKEAHSQSLRWLQRNLQVVLVNATDCPSKHLKLLVIYYDIRKLDGPISGDAQQDKEMVCHSSYNYDCWRFTAGQNTIGKATNNSNALQISDKRKEKQTPNFWHSYDHNMTGSSEKYHAKKENHQETDASSPTRIPISQKMKFRLHSVTIIAPSMQIQTVYRKVAKSIGRLSNSERRYRQRSQ